MKIVSVVGTRPQIVKLSPIYAALETRAEHLVVHTGQHYSDNLSKFFFRDLGMSLPTVNFNIGSGTHAEQTAAILVPLEKFLTDISPNWVISYGDTNSALGTALATSKLGFKLAHLEAGLRSGNRTMPEEINRITIDHLSDLNLAPSETAMSNLSIEGLAGRSKLVGDVMVDSLHFAIDKIKEDPSFKRQSYFSGNYLLATFHRQELMNSKNRLKVIISKLSNHRYPVFLAAHPLLRKRLEEFNLMDLVMKSLQILPPLGFLEMIDALSRSKGLVTDSGGLQKEAYLLGVPCLTIRPETEWVETLQGERNKLIWEDLQEISEFPFEKSSFKYDPLIYGDGKSALRVADLLLE